MNALAIIFVVVLIGVFVLTTAFSVNPYSGYKPKKGGGKDVSSG